MECLECRVKNQHKHTSLGKKKLNLRHIFNSLRIIFIIFGILLLNGVLALRIHSEVWMIAVIKMM